MNTLYVDGCCNKHTIDEENKVEAWASVVDENNQCMLSLYEFPTFKTREVELPVGKRTVIISQFSDVSKNQNNGAELLSFIAALYITREEDYKYKHIYSDSQLIVDYWSKGQYNVGKLSKEKIAYIKEATELRREFEKHGGRVLKISGASNPADLGYHR